MPTTRYLTVAYVRILHDYGVRIFMPTMGLMTDPALLNPSGLDSAVARPRQDVFGKAVHRGIHRKGAALFHALIANHPFGDGNKRTAVLALQHFYLANNHMFFFTDAELVALALSVAKREDRDHEELLEEITNRLRGGSLPFRNIPKERYKSLTRYYRGRARSIRGVLKDDYETASRALQVILALRAKQE